MTDPVSDDTGSLMATPGKPVRVTEEHTMTRSHVTHNGVSTQPASSSGASQPAHDNKDSDVVTDAVGDEAGSLTAPPGKRIRVTEDHSTKRKDIQPETFQRASKQQRLSSYFELGATEHETPTNTSAGTAASSSAGPEGGREAEARQKNTEIFLLCKELQKYRREHPGALDLEMEIQQCSRLRNWPPALSTLDSREVACLFSRTLGSRRHNQYATPDFLTMYACACDQLQWCIGNKLTQVVPMCPDSYPLMRRLHELLREEEPPAMLSRSAVLASMAQPAVLNSMPHCILKRLPKEKLRSLSSDVFFVLQMLVCMEIPSTKLEDLPGPLRVEALTQKIQLHREKYLQENRSELGFTAEDVKDSFRVFSNSHKAFGRCLRGILGIQHSQPLEQKLDELTDMFFEDVTEFSNGYTPGSVAVAVLLYQLAPCDESSTRPHVAEPRREIICKPSWRLREDISRCRGVRARYGTCSQSHACILASLGRES